MNQKVLTMSCLKNIFKFSVPTIMVKTLFETKNKRRKSVLVNLINSGLRDLEDQIKRKV